MTKQVKPPKGEVILRQYCNSDSEPVFVICSNEYRDSYTLYEVSDGKLVKLGRSKDPMNLVSKFRVEERLGY